MDNYNLIYWCGMGWWTWYWNLELLKMGGFKAIFSVDFKDRKVEIKVRLNDPVRGSFLKFSAYSVELFWVNWISNWSLGSRHIFHHQINHFEYKIEAHYLKCFLNCQSTDKLFTMSNKIRARLFITSPSKRNNIKINVSPIPDYS